MKSKIFKTGIIIISFYLILILFARPIQTLATFPQMGQEKLKMQWVEKIYLENSDNEKISWVYLDNEAEKTIFYFHGNGGSIDHFAFYINYLGSLGYNVLCYDYPGYGESEGRPSEQKVYEASELFYNYLTGEQGQSPEDIIAFGYSIGTAGAIDLAYQKDVSKLILMSPLTSRYGMSQALLGFEIQNLLFLENSFNSLNKIQDIQIPTLIMHGRQDELIPFYMGERLYKASNTKTKKFIALKKAGHNNIWQKYSQRLDPFIQKFLEQNLENKKDQLKISPEANN